MDLRTVGGKDLEIAERRCAISNKGIWTFSFKRFSVTKYLVSMKYVQPRRMGDIVADVSGKNSKEVRKQSRGKVYLEWRPVSEVVGWGMRGL